jgi:4-hydroxybenzoate polyprenyltransferase
LLGEAVMIRHTLFSLPFVLAAILLETSGRPPASKLLWIVVAATGARNAANGLNRIIDVGIDAANPRTGARHLPSGKVARGEMWAFTAFMLGLLVLGAAMLNPLCLFLLPAAGFLVAGYSYTKRFTWLCHFWLGLTCSAATMGAFLGIQGSFQWRFFPLTAGVALWVSGFDIIYALQDIEFDRSRNLHSVPARFGPKRARMMAALCHVLALAGLASVPFFWAATGLATYASIAVCSVLLVVEHALALGDSERRIRLAAYGINEIVPLIFLVGVALDLYLL